MTNFFIFEVNLTPDSFYGEKNPDQGIVIKATFDTGGGEGRQVEVFAYEGFKEEKAPAVLINGTESGQPGATYQGID